MRTKTFSAKRLLSLLLTVAMFATMILPTSVFAADFELSLAYVCLTEVEKGVQKPQLRLQFQKEVDLADDWADLMTVAGKDDWMGVGATQEVVNNKQCVYIDLGDGYTLAKGDTIEFNGAITPVDAENTLVSTSATVDRGNFDTVEVKLGTVTPADATVTVYWKQYADTYTLPAQVGLGFLGVKCEKEGYVTKVNSLEINLATIEAGEKIINIELEKLADFTALDTAITDAGNAERGKYTTASLEILDKAVEEANKISRTTTTEDEQTTVDAAATAIQNAITNLVALADYTNLTVAYNAGKAISNANGTYTAETFEVLTEALEEAEKDTNKELTVQDDVDALTKAINDAIAGLVKNVEVTFTAVAVADDAKVDYAKANKIVLVFAEPIDDAANKLVSKLNIADKVSSAVWTTETVYTLTLKENHGLDNNAEVAFDGDETIFTVSGNAMADTKANVIGNLTEAYQQVTATKMAATIVKSSAKPGVVAGDKIVLVFNAPVYQKPATITVNGMTASVVPNTANTVYEITLVDNQKIGEDYITDSTELTYGSITNVPLDGTFGTAVAPKALVAVAVDKDGTAKKTNDEIVVVFDRPTNGSEDISALSIFSDAEWNGANTELTLKVAGETGINSTIDISAMGIKDEYDMVAATGTSSLTLLGSFGTVTAPAVLSMTAVDVDGTAKTEGDLVVIVFDRPTNGSVDISGLTDFVDADWEANDTKLILTVGAGALIKNGDTLDISSMNIMDKDSIVAATNTEMTLDGSFGTVSAPLALRAYAVDNDGTELVYNKIENVEYKDQIVVVFDTPTNEASDISKINVVGTGYTASLGTKATLDWEENGTKLVITLGQDTVIKNGATIDLSDLGIMDKDNIIPAEATTLELDIEGSFGYSIQPRITKAVAFTQNDMDYIRVFFNTEVKAKAGETIDVTISGFTMGASANKALVDQNNGLTYYEIAMAKDEHSSFESGRYAISLTGIVDKETGSKELASTPVTITGAFISPITPEVLKVVAISNDGSGVAKAGDKIVAVFNTEVKLGTVSASEGYLGTGYSVNYSSTAKNVVEIVLGDAGLNVVPGTTEITFSGFMDEATESVTMANTTKLVDGNFGYSAVPEIMSATAISADGSGVAKAGDKIVVVFNTMVTYGGSDIYYYEYTLASDNEYNVGDTYEITVVSKATGISYDLEKVIEGTFGYSVMPTVKSVVISESEGREIITILFDRATNKPSFASNELNLIETNNEHLGDGIVAAWISDTVLKITLGTNASTKDTDKLNLSGLGIKAADTNAEITDIDELSITGSLIPVATDVRFVGKKIQITFSARTNGVANISNLTALLGTGATADWDAYNKVLTITLGENYTITNNGYIVLNGMGIYDGFSGDYHVVGQYKVLGSIESDKLTVAKIVAQSTDKSKTTAQKGDTIVVKFNSATDLKGAALNQILDANKVDEIITIDGGNEAALGTGYTGEWTAYDTLVITLGGKTIDNTVDPAVETGNDPAISVGTAITVANVKFANGEGLMDATPVELSGSFNGREFILTEGAITRTGANNTGDYRIAVKVEDTLLAPSVVPTVVCVAYNGTSPVSVMRICVDVENTIQPVFEFAEGLKITSAKIYVFNELFGDVNSSPSVLAETLEIK